MYIPLKLPPRIFRNGTEYQAAGRWGEANVVRWYEESESCIFHNHAERIPITRVEDRDIVQSIIDKNYHQAPGPLE